MNTRILLLVVFTAGVSSGWFAKAWFGSLSGIVTDRYPESSINSPLTSIPSTTNLQNNPDIVSLDTTRTVNTEVQLSNNTRSVNQNIVDLTPQSSPQLSVESSPGSTIYSRFQRLLSERLYDDAMFLYQEQVRQNDRSATQLKRLLLDQLQTLSKNRDSSDFSELIQSYLSVYYDDIDVLLMQADFNRANGRYYEVVDIYLLAKTYAYAEVDQQNLLARFDEFIKQIDNSYTSQQNWVPLINLYLHINASGLTSSTYQYRQAIAYLRSGDEYFAVEQLQQLLNDSLVGESAAIALNNLADNSFTGSVEPIIAADNFTWEGADAIELQKVGNQFLANATINREDSINLLIDTGASLTTLSRASFDSLISYGDAVEQDRRRFRTAGGVTTGTVYTVSEFSLGPYLLNDTQIAVLDFTMKPGVDGLLGMNVLGQFRFQIDQENTRLLLSRE